MYSASRFTFKQIVDEVLAWSGDQDDAGQLRELAKQAVRSSHERRLTLERYTFMLSLKPQQFTTVSGQLSYSLHESFLSPLYVWNVTKGQRVTIVPQQRSTEFRSNTPGSLVYAAIQGVSRVRHQPPVASVIGFTSTNVADFGKSAILIGETADGDIEQETIVLPFASNTEYVRVIDVVKLEDGWAGTLRAVDGVGTQILHLGPEVYGRQYRQLVSLTPQSGGDVIEYQFYRQPKQLIHNTDIPDIPYPFDRILTLDALIDMSGFTRPSERELRTWKDQITELESGLAIHYTDGNAEGSEALYQTLVPR